MNLLDYLDKPELLQHVDGEGVVGLIDMGEGEDGKRVLIGFDNGYYGMYSVEGIPVGDAEPCIILKPKPKRVVKGYRRVVLHEDGSITVPQKYLPSKADFVRDWFDAKEFMGEWQTIEYEIEEGE